MYCVQSSVRMVYCTVMYAISSTYEVHNIDHTYKSCTVFYYSGHRVQEALNMNCPVYVQVCERNESILPSLLNNEKKIILYDQRRVVSVTDHAVEIGLIAVPPLSFCTMMYVLYV
jgi:hypothetical protein